MPKVYTAQEMRAFADAIAGDLCGNGHRSVKYTYGDLIPVIESLRQSADAMERNKSLLRKAGELCVGLMNTMSAKHEEIKKLRALVKDLADALDCSTYRVDGLTCNVNLRHRALVARAREVI